MLHLRTIVASAFVTFAAMIGAFGVTAAVRGVQSVATSPLESRKGGTGFDERLDWNQFANPDSARLYQIITAKTSPDSTSPDEPLEGGRGGPFTPVDPAGAIDEDEEFTGSVEPTAPPIDIAALIDAQVGSDPGAVLASPRPEVTIDFGIPPAQPIAAASAPAQAQVRTETAPKKRAARKRVARAAAPKEKSQPPEPARPANPLQSLFGGNS